MNFPNAIVSGFRNYVNGRGRAARSEYWYWALFVFLLGFICSVLDAGIFPENTVSPFSSVAGIVTFLPGISVAVRRLHDIGRTGWWWLIAFTVVGIIVLIYWACQKGDAGPNAYGSDPLA
jgi:uncharacterized membrane protein YhaH (DUF805 family)